MMRLGLDDLDLFRHVVESGSITAGAARAHLALAAASSRIRRMEEALGARLLERSRQGVALTPAGHVLLDHARSLLAQSERMHDDLARFAGTAAGHVRLLSNTNALTEFLPDVLARFLALHPGMSVELREQLSDEIVSQVAEGVAEIGIVAGTVETARLETLPFRQDRFVLVVGAHDPLASRAAVDFSDIAARDFVSLERASALHRFLKARAARLGQRLRTRVELRSFEAVCRMVEAGVGVGIVPQTTARRAAQTMAIAIVPLSDGWALRDLRICVRSLAGLSVSARLLVDHLVAADGPARLRGSGSSGRHPPAGSPR